MSDIYLARDTRPQPESAPLYKDWFDTRTPVSDEDFRKQAQVFPTLLQWARRHFGEHITMQTSPIGFGRLLLLNSLPDRMHYAQLPEAISSALHGQCKVPHRIEKFDHTASQHDYEYDARVAFLSHARHMPVYFPGDRDAWLHDTGNEYVGGREAWYKVSFEVPAKWDKIGLVPASYLDLGVQNTYLYPHVPGDKGKRWLHCSEVRLLREYEWHHIIHERALFAPQSHKGADPLRLWQERLATALDGCETDLKRWKWLRVALRRIALDTIGGFLKDGKAGGGMVMTNEGWGPAEAKHVYGTMLRYHMPQFNCAITARTRAAVTRMALKVPRGQLIKIVGDAIHTTERQDWIEDTGKVGSYRLKGITKNG